jgi:hypothetical protein
MAFTAVFAACSDPMDEITAIEYQRTFSPIELKVEPSSFDQATITWKSTDGARLYDVKLSQGDSLKFTNIVQTWEDIELTRLSLADLLGQSQYSIAVRAKAFNENQEDSHWTAIEFKTSAEQIFKAVKGVEIKATSLIVHFELPHGQITRLALSPASGEETSIPLTTTDIEAGYKEVTGLTPGTDYKISIYNEDQKRGEVSATTQWKPTASETKVVIVNLGDDLATICKDDANIGKTIYLPDGYTFTTATNPGIAFAGDMTVYGDPDAAVKPKLIYTNAGGGSKLFTWGYKCNINELKFVNVVFQGSGKTGNGAMVFGSAGTSSGTDDVDVLNAVIFEKCDILDWGRTFYRVQGTYNNPIGLVSLNNCYAENVGAYGGVNGNYAFFTMNVGGGGIDKIAVTNSTFRKVYHSFVNAPQTSGNNPCKNVTIENCTFNDFITGPGAGTSRIFIDGNNNTALSIDIKGTILGQSGPKSSGYRYGTGSAIAVSGTYTTSDYFNENAAQLLPNLTESGIASTALFKDPEAGDFTIISTNFAGRNTSGDPRWR